MRHQLSGRQLSRIAPHRNAMLRNMAASLLRHETIRTTLPKAKELRRVVEPLITLGKADSDANRRRAFAQLRDADVVVKLFEDLGPHFLQRPGGYTRILRMDPRAGDAAPMALMQLVDRVAATGTPAEDTSEAKADDEAAPKAPKKKAAPAKKTSLKKRAVKSDAEKAEKAAKKQAKTVKAEAKTKARAEKKASAPKKKAAAKKKASK